MPELRVTVLDMNVSEVARQAEELVRWETTALGEWLAVSAERRGDVRSVVRAALLRLLAEPGWLPSSVRLSDGRIDVRLAIYMDVEAEHRLAMNREQLAAMRAETRAKLLALAAELEGEDA